MSLQPGVTSMAAYRWVVLLFAVLTYATSQFARQNYTGVQKFIAADFELDTAALGLLGSVFFYAYALFQLPWGIASDKFGSRWIAGAGMLLTAGAMAGFATSQSEAALLFWRVAAGAAGAAAYVAVAGALARWFPPHERGLSQGMLGGLGGALGESTAFFLLPVLSIYFASGWRNATSMMAVAIAAIGIVSLAFLRSAPPRTQATIQHPFTRDMLPDALLWCYASLFCAQVIAMRTAQAWIALYCTDVYITAYGYDVNGAAVAGGFLAMVVYSLLGRGVGVTALGLALRRAGAARRVAHRNGHRLPGGRDRLVRGALHACHRDLAHRLGCVPARPGGQLLSPHHGLDQRDPWTTEDGVRLRVHQHARPDCWRDGTRLQRVSRRRDERR